MTTGLFAWSRNPTFLGMMAVVLGAFLVAPTAVTAFVLAIAWVAFSVQIRMEEEHLHRLHGPAYGRSTPPSHAGSAFPDVGSRCMPARAILWITGNGSPMPQSCRS